LDPSSAPSPTLTSREEAVPLHSREIRSPVRGYPVDIVSSNAQKTERLPTEMKQAEGLEPTAEVMSSRAIRDVPTDQIELTK
jgi:hypothetical protein